MKFVNEDEDEKEYNIRQLKLMSNSQFNAISVAFDRAKKALSPYQIMGYLFLML